MSKGVVTNSGDSVDEMLKQIITNQAIDAVVITEVKELLEEIVEKLDNMDKPYGAGFDFES